MPISSVRVTRVLSPCVTVTVAPGTGTPANMSWPCCSANTGKEHKRQNTEHSKHKLNLRNLILRRLLDAIDNDDIHWPLGGFQFQSELFLKSSKDRRSVRIDGRRCFRPGSPGQGSGRKWIRSPLQFDIV